MTHHQQQFSFVNLRSLRPDQPPSLRNKEGDLARWKKFRRDVDPQSQAFLYCKFFEVFCRQENFEVPLKRGANGTNETFNEVTVRDLDPENLVKIISRDKVRPTLLDNLGIKYETEEIGKQHKIIVTLALVQDLIKFFDSLEPVQYEIVNASSDAKKSSPRYWVIANPKAENLQAVAGQFVRFTSSIFDEEDPIKETVARNQQASISIYQSIGDCLRGSYQQTVSSGRTVDKYLPLATVAGMLAGDFWILPTVSGTDRDLIIQDSEKLAHTVDETLAPVKADRIQAKERVEQAKSATDSKGRVNPAASALKMRAAAEGFGETIDETLRTSEFNQSDFGVLLKVYRKSKKFFDTASQRAEDRRVGKNRYETYGFFSDRYRDSGPRKTHLDQFIQLLGITDSNLSAFTFRPFRVFAEGISELKKNAYKMAESGKFPGAQQLLKDLAQLLKIPAKIYPHYLRARDLMNREDGINQGRVNMLTYLKELRGSFEEGFMPDKKKAFLAQIDRVYSAIERWDHGKQLEYLEEIRKLSEIRKPKSDAHGFTAHVERVEALLALREGEEWTDTKQLTYLKELADTVDIEARLIGWMKG